MNVFNSPIPTFGFHTKWFVVMGRAFAQTTLHTRLTAYVAFKITRSHITKLCHFSCSCSKHHETRNTATQFEQGLVKFAQEMNSVVPDEFIYSWFL